MKTVNLQRLSEEDLTSYNDSNIAILKSFKEIQNVNNESVLIDSFVLAVVTEGNAQLIIEDQQLNLSEGDIFACKPNLILKSSMMSLDFDIIGLFIGMAYAEKIFSLLNLSWNIRFANNGYETWTCSPEEKERFIAYSEILEEKLESPDSANKQKSLNMLFCSMVYDMLDIRSRKEDPLFTQSFTSAEYILNRFAKMLSDRSQAFLNVNEYAEKLHVSPKYFSAICKKQTGKTLLVR